MSDDSSPQNKIILYQAENGKVRVDVEFDGDTVWLSQALMAELYQTSPQNITQHVREIYRDGECSEESTCKESLQVRLEGQRRVRRSIKLYNLTMIMAVGFRVRSERGVLFRQWAVERLREYALKGFALDDERLKAGGGGLYFDELLARIRDIRSSEKIFWRKVLDIYATSIDYDPRAEASQAFFATVQNKMHWAIHGHTAAELVVSRLDPESPNLGITNWPGTALRKSDASIAKNYLTEKELDELNRIVTAYLEFAELQAMSRKPMTMEAWITKLDDFLKLSDREILTHAGAISHEVMLGKVDQAYQRYQALMRDEPTSMEKDMQELAKRVKIPRRVND
ncbi:MAG: hypothetical protein FD137_261 [Spirochaetes bacterium]|nr:MAG: hypothetical protein FD137_261 [Spirochaetota bacterium]